MAILAASCAVAPPSTAARAGVEPATAEGVAANQVLANVIYAKLNADPFYFFRHVDVSVDHGVANLSGYVWSTDAIYHARYIARSVPGISAVVTSQLELERNGFSSGVTR